MNKIILRNQFDIPFGKLSNHFYHPMIIDDRKYNTVTNYILSNLLTIPINKDIIQTKDIKGSILSDKMINILNIVLSLNNQSLSIDDKHKLIKDLIKLPIYNINITPVFLKSKFASLETTIKSLLSNTEKTQEKYDEIKKLLYLTTDELSIIKQVKKDLENAYIADANDIYATFESLQHQEYEMFVKTSVETAYHNLFNVNEENLIESQTLVDRLLSTGNLYIYYVDDNDILGTGKIDYITTETLKKSRGQNYIGKLLMSIRYQINSKASLKASLNELENKKNFIYDNYLAYTILKKIMIEKSVKHLESYKNMSIKDLLEKAKSNQIFLTRQELLDKDIVNILYEKKQLEKGLLDNIGKSSNGLISGVITHNKDKIHKQLEDKKLDTVLTMYMKYVLTKTYSVSPYDEDMNIYIGIEKSKLSPDKYTELRNRIYDLYKIGMLSESLSEKIDEELSKLESENVEIIEDENNENSNSSDKDDIKEFREEVKEEKKEDKEEKKEEEKKDEGFLILHSRLDNPIPEYFKVFLPNEFNFLIRIDGRNYPTVYHYMYTVLLSKTGIARYMIPKTNEAGYRPGIGMNDAYKMILVGDTYTGNNLTDFKSILDVKSQYEKIRSESMRFFKIYYNKIGLNKKFENQILLEILLLTDNMPIYWLEPNSVLGVDDKLNGENMTGKYLMELRVMLRGKYFINYKTQSSEFENMIFEDSFLKNWIDGRLKDICDMTYRFQTYINKKYGFFQVIDKEFVKFITKEFYSDCSYILQKTETSPPQFFINRVNNCIGMPSFLYKQQSKELKDKKSSIDRQIKQLTQEYEESKKTTKRSEDEINEFKNKQKREYKEFTSDKENKNISEFKEKQKHEYNVFLGLEKKTINRTPDQINTFHRKQQIEYQKFKKQLDQNKNITQKEKTKLKKEFTNNQTAEYNKFYGINVSNTDTDEMNFQHKIKSLKENFNNYQSALKRKIEKLQENSSKVANIYWRHIFSMLLFILSGESKNSKVNQLKLKQIIVNSQLLLSNTYECNKLVKNTDDNCILSAILNILRKIHNFKDKYSPQKKIDIDDINMCKSIILNTSVEVSLVENVDETFIDYTDEKYEQEIKDIDRSDNKDEDSDFISYEDIEEGEKSDDENDGEDYGEIDDNYEENPYFSFNGGDDKIVKELVEINPYLTAKEATKLVKHIFKTISFIKKYAKMAPNVKQNRINFFATLN